jgi:outer membrane protein assembly factor BamB
MWGFRSDRSATLGCAALALALTACQVNVDWATWGFGVERHGDNPNEQTIGPSNVAQLRHLWSVDLGAIIDASPVVATGIDVGGTPTDVVYVGTEHGALFAINTNGDVLWQRDLGMRQANCLDSPDLQYGVSASVVFDRQGNRVFVAGGDGYVYALDPATGATIADWPVRVTPDPAHEFVESAPSLFGDQLYVELAAHCDIRPYHGRVVGINTSTRAKRAFWVTGKTGPDGGGIWGWGGASVDPANGDVFVATGNAFADPENYLYADHVVRLSSTLQVKAAHAPGVSMTNDDFGSTPVLFQKSGCPPQLVTQQKNGSLYLYDRDAIAAGYRQVVVVRPGGAFIGVPAYSPETQMVYVPNQKQPAGSPYTYGMLAFNLDANCMLQLAWQTTAGPNGGIPSTPTVANGVVYYSDGYMGTMIHAFDASTGVELWTSGTDVAKKIMAAPVVANGQLFAGAWDNHLHAWGL